MTKYNPDQLKEMTQTVLTKTGTMEYIALVNIVAGLWALLWK